MELARVDRWLWAVRASPTRSASTALCRAGHVKVNGRPAKASTTVRPGDTVTARIGERERVLEVVRAIENASGRPSPRSASSTAARRLRPRDHAPGARPRSFDRPSHEKGSPSDRPPARALRQTARARRTDGTDSGRMARCFARHRSVAASGTNHPGRSQRRGAFGRRRPGGSMWPWPSAPSWHD